MIQGFKQRRGRRTVRDARCVHRLIVLKIVCMGGGYVGICTSAVLSSQTQIPVTIFDVNKGLIEQWSRGDLPFYEPGLEDLLKSVSLDYSSDPGVLSGADLIFIAVGTPTKRTGVGANKAHDLRYVESATNMISKYCDSGIIVEKSTVPVRTSTYIAELLSPFGDFSVLSNPEFLAQGSAIDGVMNPDRVLIGATQGSEDAVKVLTDLYRHWVPPDKIINCHAFSSELAKLASNAFLAQRLSAINSLSQICECVGADIDEVALCVGSDSRIGKSYLMAGPGFGGSCLPKDVLSLIYICEYLGLDEAALMWKSVYAMNQAQKRHVGAVMIEAYRNTLAGKRIAVLGFAFKPNTSDIRETPAIDICNMLLREGAVLALYDPEGSKSLFAEHISGEFSYENSAMDAIAGSHAILVHTRWPEFSQLNLRKAFQSMKHPQWIFDTQRVVDRREAEEIGFRVFQVGRPHQIY